MGNSIHLTVRKLRAGDVRTIARILGPQIRNMPTGANADAESIGRDLFANLLERHTEDLWSWLADLAGMTADDLDKQPLTAPGEIIKQVLEDEDIGPFARQLRTLLQKAQTPAGTSSQPATDGQTKRSTH